MGAGGSTFASQPDAQKTRPSEAGLKNLQQMENQSRKAAGVGELLRVDMDKMGDKIKDKLKWQTSLRWMVYELANREKVSEGCRQVGSFHKLMSHFCFPLTFFKSLFFSHENHTTSYKRTPHRNNQQTHDNRSFSRSATSSSSGS